MNARRYETVAVALLCLAFGIVNFEMFGINYLMPFIQPDLQLSNTQIGALMSGFWITFALSSYLTGVFTDKFGRHKTVLLAALLPFSVLSVLSGFATSFLALLAARLLMGLLEGPVLPLVQSFVVLESPVERRGLNMGIVQSLGSSILGSFIAPLLLVHLAEHLGWQPGFWIAAIPGLLCCALIAWLLRSPPPVPSHDAVDTQLRGGLREILRYRNVVLCALASCFALAYITIGVAFAPLYLTEIKRLSTAQMGLLMSVLGVSGVILGVALPALSDRSGRKPVAIAAGILGCFCPLAVLWYDGSLQVLGLFMFIGWSTAGSVALFFATIPSESVPMRLVSTTIGFILATSTFVGGVAGPSIAGWSADHWGLQAPMLLQAGCAAAVGVIALLLKETAPMNQPALRSDPRLSPSSPIHPPAPRTRPLSRDVSNWQQRSR